MATAPNNLPHRKSIRLKNYDYSLPNAYFVTLCVEDRQMLFGEIIDGRMKTNALGEAVEAAWAWLAERYPYVELDYSQIMPNHFHGILLIVNSAGGSRTAPTSEGAPTGGKRKSLGRLVGAFKTVSTKAVHAAGALAGQDLWQRNFYEHIVRNERELPEIRKYIEENPLKWSMDRENPEASQVEPLPWWEGKQEPESQ